MALQSLLRCALGLWLACAAATPAAADAVADFNAAIEGAMSHGRVALGYLRSGNLDLAAGEIAELRDAWAGVVERFGGSRPPPFKDATLYVTTFTDVSTRIVTASLMLDSGRPAIAIDALNAIRGELSALRHSGGLYLLADCVLEANAAFKPLDDLDEQPPDWTRADTASHLRALADRYREVLRRCDGAADTVVHSDPQFRRLIEGGLGSLGFVPQIIADKDNGLLHRILGELRAIDRLLTFRFG